MREVRIADHDNQSETPEDKYFDELLDAIKGLSESREQVRKSKDLRDESRRVPEELEKKQPG